MRYSSAEAPDEGCVDTRRGGRIVVWFRFLILGTLAALLLTAGAALVVPAGSFAAGPLDPLLVQSGPKFVAGDEANAGRFGASVELASDGSMALIGGPDDNGGAGAAWVFTRSGNAWTKLGSKLVGGGEIGAAGFGARVALSGDGDTALVSGPADDNNGAVWVFTRSGNTWTQQAKLQVIGPGPATEPNEFGSSLALSFDGNTALIGGMTTGSPSAEAWVFTRSNGTWAQQGPVLTASGAEADDEAISSVALSADGNTALLGAPATTTTQGIVTFGFVGAAWVFTRSGGTWSQQAEFGAGDPVVGNEFGASVALSADGNTALVGAPDPGSTIGLGSAWVFTRSSGTWAQEGPSLTGAGETAGGLFGASVALSGDGNTALVGAPNDNNLAGGAWAFAQSGGVWAREASGLTGSGEDAAGGFGSALTLSSDGSTALIGGPGDDNVGAVWGFVTGHALSVSVGGGGSGTVTGNGISCPNMCMQSLPSGTVVTLTAAAQSGSSFAGWSGAGCLGTAACTVTVSADENVTATFTAIPTATPEPEASCTIKPTTGKVPLHRTRHATAPRLKPGTLTLHVRCNQNATARLTAKLIETIGKKPKGGKQHTKQLTLRPINTSVTADTTQTVTVSLPKAALIGLRHHARESVSFSLIATNANGTRRTTTRIGRLKPA